MVPACHWCSVVNVQLGGRGVMVYGVVCCCMVVYGDIPVCRSGIVLCGDIPVCHLGMELYGDVPICHSGIVLCGDIPVCSYGGL